MAINYWFNTSLDQWTKDRQQYKDTKKKEAAQKAEAERQTQWDVLFDCALNSTDTKTIQQYTSASNLNDLAVSIGKWINETTWKTLKPWLKDNDIVCSYLNKYPEKERDVNNYLSNKITLEEAQNKLGLYKTIPNENQYIESDTTADKAKRRWVWLWLWTLWVWALGAATKYWGIGLEQWGKWLYGQTYDSNINEERFSQKLGAEKRTNEYFTEKARTELEEAKKTWVWVEEAQKKLDALERKWKTLPWREGARTLRDTAFENRLWWGVFDNWSAAARWEEARSRAEIKWQESVEPLLKESKETVNIQNLIDSLEKEIKTLDPDRAKELEKAFKSLKESYSDPKYANFSLADAEWLKSELQWRTPQKFFKEWKFKSESDITDAVAELRGELSKKLRQEVLDKLEKEGLENAWDVFRDYANLIEIADREAALATRWWLKWGAGKFVSTVYETAAQPSFRKAWLLINKSWQKLQKSIPAKVWSWAEKNWSKVVNTLKWRMSVKNIANSMRAWVFDPVWMIELWELIPWSLWEMFKTAANVPAVSVDEAMYNAASYVDTWNDMSEDERIQQIMEEYNSYGDDKINETDARASYDMRLKDHPDGKMKLKDIGSLQIVKSA